MYNRDEIQKILNLAFELQNRSEGSRLPDEIDQKLTFEEIKEIAQESGLSPDYIRQAMLEFEGIPIEEPLFLDTGNTYEAELIGFAKGELNKKTWAELRSVIEFHFNSPGKIKRRPEGIVWKAQPKGISKFLHTRKSPVVEASSTGNKTTIRIRQSLKTIHRLIYLSYAAFIGAGAFLAAAVSEGAEFLFLVAGMLFVARLFQKWTGKRKKAAQERLMDTMEDLQTIVTRWHKAGEVTGEGASKQLAQIEIEETIVDETAAETSTTTARREKTKG